MSGHSEQMRCPNCGEDANSYVEWKHKPFAGTWLWCPHCGLTVEPKHQYMELDELNEYRREQDGGEGEDNPYPPLAVLPEQEWTL